jgi:predicted Zn-dependent protease
MEEIGYSNGQPFQILTVTDKESGEIIRIKDFAYNPEKHKLITVKAKKSVSPLEIAAVGKKKEEEIIAPAENEYNDMKMFELRSLAKGKGIVVSPKTKKQELIQLLNA